MLIKFMCWAVPAVVQKVEGDTVWVDIGDGVPRPVVLGISDARVSPGDFVLVHAGVVISVLDFNAIEEFKKNYVELFTELAATSGEDVEKVREEVEKSFEEWLKAARERALEKHQKQYTIW